MMNVSLIPLNTAFKWYTTVFNNDVYFVITFISLPLTRIILVKTTGEKYVVLSS